MEKSSQGIQFREYIVKKTKQKGQTVCGVGQFSHRFKSLFDCMTVHFLFHQSQKREFFENILCNLRKNSNFNVFSPRNLLPVTPWKTIYFGCCLVNQAVILVVLDCPVHHRIFVNVRKKIISSTNTPSLHLRPVAILSFFLFPLCQ